ncbi:MAG: hypothetical protein LBV39_07040 [Bacteroidales bacterium]|jgi:hypothetical protein|nr:hypothetical protein [Bacteroidales bacterium]
MKHCHYYIFLWAITFVAAACERDEKQEPYLPESLPSFQQVNFSGATDTSVVLFNGDMQLLHGRNTTTSFGQERFTMQYAGSDLTGMEYESKSKSGTHYNLLSVSFSCNKHNMMSSLKREDWNKTYTFTYDKQFRLIFFSIELPQNGVNNYTIEYDDRSNVVAVERYSSIAGTEGTIRTEYSGYDSHPNPFRLLVNVFYAPVFASSYGALRWEAIPLGMLLSANNPGKTTESRGTETSYQYEYGANDYPVSIKDNAGTGTFPLNIEYK